MRNSNKITIYTEDSFDLEEHKKKFGRFRLRKKMIRQNKKAVALLAVLTTCLFILASVFVVRIYKYRLELRKNAIINETTRETADTNASSSEAAANPPPESEYVKPEAPVADEPKKTLEKIVSLREAFGNDDIVGHIKIEGTDIDYAIAQSEDNVYYLYRDLYGEENIAGSIYMDYECDARNLSRNTVIYGHNMKNGSMFHNIRYYSDMDFYKEHRFISLTTEYEETLWEVFSFYKTGTDFYYIQVLFKNDEEFSYLVSAMKERSLYDTGVSVDGSDKILTLSTCANTPDDARLVLNARLINAPSQSKIQ